jgi:toxin YoeB
MKSKKRDLIFLPEFLEDLEYWVSVDRKMALRILKLVDAIARDPFNGIGKPKSLKHSEVSQWSRRINDEHRLVYEVNDTQIEFHQTRFHYK